MKFVIFLVCFFVVVGCGSNPNSTFNQEENARTPHFDVKKVNASEYRIVYYGSPLSTSAETRDEWDFKAKGVC